MAIKPDALANRLSSATAIAIDGEWMRHVPIRYRAAGLDGHAANGRWSRSGGFPVVYLGRPRDSVVVEAYRHLVDGIEGMRAEFVAPRVCLTCSVDVANILDLTTAGGRATAGLDMETLTSPTNDLDAYERCREVSATAHQLGFRGLVSPAATGMGKTLVLFSDLLEEPFRPKIVHESEWHSLPADPRAPKGLRLVKGEG